MVMFCKYLNIKKAPTARVGIAEGAILPFNPPGGMRNDLDYIADVRWLKGLVYMQSL